MNAKTQIQCLSNYTTKLLCYDVLVIKESMKLLASSIDCVYFATKNRLIFQERK